MTDVDTGLHYPIDLGRLPSGWCADYVQSFSKEIQSGFACGRHSAEDIGIAHLRPMNVSRNGIIDLSEVKYVDQKYDERRLRKEDVLFNNTNSPELIGKTAYVGSDGVGLAFSNHMTRVRFSSGVNAKFAAYQLHYLWMSRYYLHKCVKHVNQASISSREFGKSIPFVVAPTREQDRIVAKIEELLSELDKGVESLKKAREQLKVYRQSVLKHAFEGKLTAQWREKNKDKLETTDELLDRITKEREQRYRKQLKEWKAAVTKWEAEGKVGKKPGKPRKPAEWLGLESSQLSMFPPLPKEWTYVQLGLIVDEPQYGTSRKCHHDGEGVGVLRIPNIANGVIDDTDLKFAQFNSSEIDVYRLRKGDILTIRSNGSISIVGQSAQVREKEEKYLYAGYLIRLCPNRQIVSTDYLISILSSHFLRTQIEGKAKSTSGVHNINSRELQTLILPICCVDEQHAITKLLSIYRSRIERMISDIDVELIRSEKMRQSILKKAFSGRLVEQDPNDEPASVLLERIRAEKASLERKNSKAKRRNVA